MPAWKRAKCLQKPPFVKDASRGKVLQTRWHSVHSMSSGRQPASLTSGFIDDYQQVFDDAQCEQCPARFAGQLGYVVIPQWQEPNAQHTVCMPCTRICGCERRVLQCPNGTEPNTINSTCMPCRAGHAGILGLCTRCCQLQPNDARTTAIDTDTKLNLALPIATMTTHS